MIGAKMRKTEFPTNSPDYNHQQKISQSRGPGFNLPSHCDICGKTRANNNHQKCSKIRQQRTKL